MGISAIFNKDIQAIENGDFKTAFKLIEKENAEFKKRVLKNINKNLGNYIYGR